MLETLYTLRDWPREFGLYAFVSAFVVYSVFLSDPNDQSGVFEVFSTRKMCTSHFVGPLTKGKRYDYAVLHSQDAYKSHVTLAVVCRRPRKGWRQDHHKYKSKRR